MDAAALQALVLKLLLAIQTLSGYAPPEAPPEVLFLPPEELQQRACNGRCAVFGWFPPGRIIYLEDRLDPVGDLRARAVLLHELVHFLQQENGAYEGPATCRTWLAREREAVDLEWRWLKEQPGARRAMGRDRRVPLEAFCRDDPPQGGTAPRDRPASH